LPIIADKLPCYTTPFAAGLGGDRRRARARPDDVQNLSHIQAGLAGLDLAEAEAAKRNQGSESRAAPDRDYTPVPWAMSSRLTMNGSRIARTRWLGARRKLPPHDADFSTR